MTRNVERLQNGSSASSAGNLREALRIRLSILNDNVQGFVSAEDIDRRERYASIETLLEDVMINGTESLPAATLMHVLTSESTGMRAPTPPPCNRQPSAL